MAASGIGKLVARVVVHAVPHREGHLVLLGRGKMLVEGREHRAGIAEVGSGQRLRTQHVRHRDGKQGGANPVPGDVDEVDGQAVLVEPVVAERVAAQHP